MMLRSESEVNTVGPLAAIAQPAVAWGRPATSQCTHYLKSRPHIVVADESVGLGQALALRHAGGDAAL